MPFGLSTLLLSGFLFPVNVIQINRFAVVPVRACTVCVFFLSSVIDSLTALLFSLTNPVNGLSVQNTADVSERERNQLYSASINAEIHTSNSN